MLQEIGCPVRLLRDDRGIYGIGGELHNFSHGGEGYLAAVVLRPDRLANVEVGHQLGLLSSKYCYPILQAIPIGLWIEALEERLRREVLRELCRRAGPVYEALGEEGFRRRRKWWS